MTCIVAKVVNGDIHMAGDKRASGGQRGFTTPRPKVFFNGDFLIGYTTSFRMGQLLEFSWEPPKREEGKCSEERFIYTQVIDSVKHLFEEKGFDKGGDDGGGEFLLGYKGKLYRVLSDYSIIEAPFFMSVGSGEDIALAVLTVLAEMGHTMTEEEQLGYTISVTSKTYGTVSEEYDYLCLKG